MRNEIPAINILESMILSIISSGEKLVIDGSFWAEIGDLVESDTLDAKSPEALVSAAAQKGRELLDFGCGTGGHRAFLEHLGYNWTGVNYRDGMASSAAQAADELLDKNMFYYDGLTLPFLDEWFDLVYSFQVFEHIQDIGVTFKEISRVLKPGGKLIGAVSYLEQSHDYSTYNFTPYGFKLAAEKAGLKVCRLYPRADAFSFLARRLLIVTSGSNENSISPHINANNNIHRAMGEYALRHGGYKEANLFRLMFSTHFAFDVYKP